MTFQLLSMLITTDVRRRDVAKIQINCIHRVVVWQCFFSSVQFTRCQTANAYNLGIVVLMDPKC